MTASLKICKMVKTNPAWKEYVCYLNGVVVESLMLNILSSLVCLTSLVMCPCP